MLDATTLMNQAANTAEHWMLSAKSFVERTFPEYSSSSKADLIAAYIQAAALDEVAMYVRTHAETHEKLAQYVEGIEHNGVKIHTE